MCRKIQPFHTIWKTAQTFNKFHGKNHQNHNNIDSKCHPSFISLCRNPSAWCSKHHIFRFLILESGLYGIVNQYVPPDEDGDSLKVVPLYYIPIWCLFFPLSRYIIGEYIMLIDIFLSSYLIFQGNIMNALYFIDSILCLLFTTRYANKMANLTRTFLLSNSTYVLLLFHMVLSNWIQLQLHTNLK